MNIPPPSVALGPVVGCGYPGEEGPPVLSGVRGRDVGAQEQPWQQFLWGRGGRGSGEGKSHQEADLNSPGVRTRKQTCKSHPGRKMKTEACPALPDDPSFGRNGWGAARWLTLQFWVRPCLQPSELHLAHLCCGCGGDL